MKNVAAVALGKLSAKARKKKLGKKFNQSMKDLRKKGKQRADKPWNVGHNKPSS